MQPLLSINGVCRLYEQHEALEIERETRGHGISMALLVSVLVLSFLQEVFVSLGKQSCTTWVFSCFGHLGSLLSGRARCKPAVLGLGWLTVENGKMKY